MNRPNHTARLAILQALDEIGSAAGAARIHERLAAAGMNLQPRTVRFYLRQLDQEGLTRLVNRRAGRELTEQGRRELAGATIIHRVGFVAARIDALLYEMSYDLQAKAGTIVCNVATIPKDCLVRALEVIRPIFLCQLGMGSRLATVSEGEKFAGQSVPQGRIALGTVCSVTINGILFKQGIPVVSRYGGLLEIVDRQPVRFHALIEYSGTTLDPLETFIRAGMTRVRECARTGCGIIGVSFREVPAGALRQLQQLREVIEREALGGILAVGTPSQPLFGVPVTQGRVGVIVAGGLNPIAALYEAGLPVEFHSLAAVEDIALFPDMLARR